MIAKPQTIPDVVMLEPRVFHDDRGSFFESFNLAQLESVLGRSLRFVQDNHSTSHQHVLRGLHYQIKQPQGKLIKVMKGEIFDVVVDLRRHSTTFGQSAYQILSHAKHQQLWVPEGFAHGFLTLSDSAEVLYKTTDYYAPEHERCLRWDEPTLNIPWPLELAQGSTSATAPILSAKDAQGTSLEEAETFP
jgi:dTDP-4-dehydrorhamnose 3,5-epimerase